MVDSAFTVGGGDVGQKWDLHELAGDSWARASVREGILVRIRFGGGGGGGGQMRAAVMTFSLFCSQLVGWGC